MNKIFAWISGLLMLATLVACGGGGAGSSNGCVATTGPGVCTALYTTAGSSIQLLPKASQTFTVGGGTPPYSVSTTSEAVQAGISGTSLTITGSAGGGTGSVVVTDSAGKQVTIAVTVGTGVAFFTNAPSTISLGVGSVTSPFLVGGGSGVYGVSTSNVGVANVGMSGNSNMFVITAVASGTATVVVFDNAGNKSNITVTVGGGTTAALYTTAGTGGVGFNVGAAANTFSIGGGQPPYSSSSTNTGVATATVLGSNLTITPIGAGTATVNVFDSSGSGTPVAITVTVTAGSGSSTPSLYTTAPSTGVTLPVNNQATYVIGGGTAPYTVNSSNIGVATVTPVSPTTTTGSFTITSIAAGSASIAVIDATGKQILVSVTVSPAASTKLYTTASSGGVSFPVNSSNNTFTVGGGTPPYSATSSAATVATVSISAGTLTINTLAAGSTTVAVTDSLGTQVLIPVTVSNGPAVSLYTTAPSSGITLSVGNSGTYTIGGGTAPYFAVSSNVAAATITASATNQVSGNSLIVTSVAAGTSQITVTDTAGTKVTFPVTVAAGSTAALTFLPSAAAGNVGNTMNFNVYGGTPPYTLNTNNLTVATAPNPSTVAASGGSFSVVLNSVGTAVVTVLDSAGVSQTLNIVARTNTGVLSLSPSAFVLGQDSMQTPIPLTIMGGSGNYAAYTSDLVLSSVSISGSTLNVGLGTQGNRCLTAAQRALPTYSSQTGLFSITLTVVDTSNNASATSAMSIQYSASTNCPVN